MTSRIEKIITGKDIKEIFWENATLYGVHIMQRGCVSCNVFLECRPVFGWWPNRGKDGSPVTASGVHMGQEDCAIKELF